MVLYKMQATFLAFLLLNYVMLALLGTASRVIYFQVKYRDCARTLAISILIKLEKLLTLLGTDTQGDHS